MRSENGWGEAQESAWQAFARGRVEQEGRGAKGSEGEGIGENCEEGRSIISKGRGRVQVQQWVWLPCAGLRCGQCVRVV